MSVLSVVGMRNLWGQRSNAREQASQVVKFFLGLATACLMDLSEGVGMVMLQSKTCPRAIEVLSIPPLYP